MPIYNQGKGIVNRSNKSNKNRYNMNNRINRNVRIGVGNTVVDDNPNWARYGQRGTVVSRTNNTITWRSNIDGKLITDPIKDMRLIRWL